MTNRVKCDSGDHEDCKKNGFACHHEVEHDHLNIQENCVARGDCKRRGKMVQCVPVIHSATAEAPEEFFKRIIQKEIGDNCEDN